MNGRYIVILGVACAMACISASAQTAAVYSVNEMGFQHIDVPASAMNLASVPYDSESNSINDVLKNQLTPGVDLNTGDVAYFFDPSGQVYRLAYFYTDGTNTYWVDNQTQTPATNRITPGMGFWLRSHQTSNELALVMGEVSRADAITNEVVPGLQLLSYPYPTSVGLSQLSLSNGATRGEAPDSADTLYVWDRSSQSFNTYYYYTDGSLVDFATGNPATNTLAPGDGFWYHHIGSEFSWVEIKPYAWP